MKRFMVYICVLAGAVAMPSGALAAGSKAVHGSITGKINYVGASTLTIQTGGRMIGVINALTRSANAITGKEFPYVYGGGHGEAGVPSIGIRGPGYNGRRIGYDCSGSVAAVLAGAGLWAPGSGVPNDAGIIAQLLHEKLIARGPGKAPNEVNLYDNPGVHIFMNINGRFFGTSDGGGGNPKGGPTWLDDGAPDSFTFKRYHFLPRVLKNKTSYGHSFTFQTASSPSLVTGAENGDKVTVTYSETKTGSMTARAIQYAGAVTTTGTVTSVAPDGSSVTLQTPTGQTLTLSTSLVTTLIDGLEVGDGVQVTYSTDPAGLLVPHALQILSEPSPPQPTQSYPSPGGWSGQSSGR
ncbi:MAG: hypothetical protein WAK93_02040 [Solirubrobacteraceae bacterium]